MLITINFLFLYVPKNTRRFCVITLLTQNYEEIGPYTALDIIEKIVTNDFLDGADYSIPFSPYLQYNKFFKFIHEGRIYKFDDKNLLMFVRPYVNVKVFPEENIFEDYENRVLLFKESIAFLRGEFGKQNINVRLSYLVEEQLQRGIVIKTNSDLWK